MSLYICVVVSLINFNLSWKLLLAVGLTNSKYEMLLESGYYQIYTVVLACNLSKVKQLTKRVV